MPIDLVGEGSLHFLQFGERIRFERAGNKCEWCGAENRKPHPITVGKDSGMKITQIDLLPLPELQEIIANMEIDSELRFTVYKHGYYTTFWIQRTVDGWREQNDLYGLQEGYYGQWFADLDSFDSELHSILDK